MKKTTVLLMITVMLSTLGACAIKKGHSFLENMTNDKLSSCLIKGKTTREEVRARFGDPEDIDHLLSDNEIWLYKFTRSSAKGANYIPIVSSVYRGTNDSTTKLKIIFDKKGKVMKHSLSQAKGQTKLGLFQ